MVYYTQDSKGNIKGHVYHAPKPEKKQLDIIRIKPDKTKTVKEINQRKKRERRKIERQMEARRLRERSIFRKMYDGVTYSFKRLIYKIKRSFRRMSYTSWLELSVVIMVFAIISMYIYIVENSL